MYVYLLIKMIERLNGKFKYKGNIGEIFYKFYYNRNVL